MGWGRMLLLTWDRSRDRVVYLSLSAQPSLKKRYLTRHKVYTTHYNCFRSADCGCCGGELCQDNSILRKQAVKPLSSSII
ncbi:hypothetical protein M408DRAFT_112938 [Serendipita vermifera MAFF 305830]|uniref:Uncharacterized protein n=1 Tax=Serendipita vermifera MAFF 305830 TaxID=933852 RepID=A0A0C3BBA8_SERVB|nr:hypothetical protein M408DRAFT_112938 [Serendipita vermifera MAFF 305830]